jgi:hypothetical protein
MGPRYGPKFISASGPIFLAIAIDAYNNTALKQHLRRQTVLGAFSQSRPASGNPHMTDKIDQRPDNMKGNRMTVRILTAVSLCAAMVACAPQESRIKTTSSGYPEGVFANTTVGDVRNKVIAGCDMRGIAVEQTSDNSVICGKTVSGGDAVVAQLLVENAYSTTPEEKIRFTIYQIGSDVEISAHEWVESQMPFGQVRQVELNSNNQFNDMQRYLYSLGAS